MARQTKDDLEDELCKANERANDLAIKHAAFRASVNAIIDLADEGSIDDVETMLDYLRKLYVGPVGPMEAL